LEPKYLALVTATVQEMKSLLIRNGQEVPFLHTGSPIDWNWKQQSFLLVVTGIGPVNASLEIGKLLGRRSLKGVINFGIAGAFDTQKHPLLSTVVINKEIWPEYGVITEDGLDAKGLKYPLGWFDNQDIWDRISINLDEQSCRLGIVIPRRWQQGSSLTVAGVSGAPEIARQRHQWYAADFENMEGFALAWACLPKGIPFLEIRTISNRVGSRAQHDWNIRGALEILSEAFEEIFSAQIASK
jgi:futalosine hydrolase